jgi:hypothetical protein
MRSSFLRLSVMTLAFAPAAALQCVQSVMGSGAVAPNVCRRHEPVVLMPRKQAARLILIDGNNLVRGPKLHTLPYVYPYMCLLCR